MSSRLLSPSREEVGGPSLNRTEDSTRHTIHSTKVEEIPEFMLAPAVYQTPNFITSCLPFQESRGDGDLYTYFTSRITLNLGDETLCGPEYIIEKQVQVSQGLRI